MNSFALLAQSAPDVGNAAGGVLGLIAIVWIIGIVGAIFWLWMLFDALTNEPTTEQKILWFLVIFFLPFLGAVAYLIIRKAGGREPSRMA